jgi:uncharacterized protein
MTDLLAAIGLVLVLEGALYALFPSFMKQMAARLVETPGDTLRLAGTVSVALGVIIYWLVRG